MTVLFNFLHWCQKLTVSCKHQPNKTLSFRTPAVREKQLQAELRQLVAHIRPSSSADQLVKLARIYQEMGRNGDALAVYLQAWRKEPNNAEVLKGSISFALSDVQKRRPHITDR